MYKVGLIGYGAFGKLLVDLLSTFCDFEIYSPHSHPEKLEVALVQPIIVFALPPQYLEKFINNNQPKLRRDALYIDTFSIKIKPVAIMRRLLPADASIIATHPLFGPATAKQGFAGQKIMVHPVRVSPDVYAQFRQFLEEIQLEIIETTPEKHDKAMAYVQGLSHYIGRAMQEMKIPETELATRAYKDLLDMKYVQGNDSDELFDAIANLNPYTAEVFEQFKEAQQALNKKFGL